MLVRYFGKKIVSLGVEQCLSESKSRGSFSLVSRILSTTDVWTCSRGQTGPTDSKSSGAMRRIGVLGRRSDTTHTECIPRRRRLSRLQSNRWRGWQKQSD
jgi:hypothetical protein